MNHDNTQKKVTHSTFNKFGNAQNEISLLFFNMMHDAPRLSIGHADPVPKKIISIMFALKHRLKTKKASSNKMKTSRDVGYQANLMVY